MSFEMYSPYDSLSMSARSNSDRSAQARAVVEHKTLRYTPSFNEIRFEDIEQKAKYDAHEQAYLLLKELIAKSAHTDRPLQVATAESLTAGLIFATLGDIPMAGAHKYGSFSVYDTDAKRMFLGVHAPDVYTHRCATEMALGVLRNSNATLAIAVSGNAMPAQAYVDPSKSLEASGTLKLGEVFISIAGYVLNATTQEAEMITSARVYNFCNEPDTPGNFMANLWVEIINEENELRAELAHPERFPKLTDGFNEYLITSHLSSFIRHCTVKQACKDATAFLLHHSCIVPDFIHKADDMDALSARRGYVNGVLGSKHGEGKPPVLHGGYASITERDGSFSIDGKTLGGKLPHSTRLLHFDGARIFRTTSPL
jgi:nicotinamide mononucleotide (NMN) deamidase PncC